MPVPSGLQIRLTHRDQELTVVTVGAGLRTYTVAGQAVLDGYGETETCSGGRGQVLMPWPNRVRDGRFEWDGRVVQMALSEPEHHNAIHGLVRWAPWMVTDQTSNQVSLAYRLYPQEGWAWILDLTITYALSDAGLHVYATLLNQPGGAGRCPIGAGWHPYLYAFGRPVDDAVLTVPAETAYLADERGLPQATQPVAQSGLDFRSGRQIGPLKLDTAFTDLTRDGDGRAVVQLAEAGAAGRSIRLWMEREFTHVMVFSGDTLSDTGRRRRALAVEPMTCAPDMLRSGDGRIVLEEGETSEVAWGLAASWQQVG
jgi:aldose 1-epimerase